MNITFLNVDLDIKSKQDISLILNELGDNILTLHHEQQENYYFARLEINRDTTSADKTINYFCGLIENLSDKAHGIWNGCYLKTFDIGYESGIKPNYFTSKIKPMTVQRIAGVGASINITIYPMNDNKSNSNS